MIRVETGTLCCHVLTVPQKAAAEHSIVLNLDDLQVELRAPGDFQVELRAPDDLQVELRAPGEPQVELRAPGELTTPPGAPFPLITSSPSLASWFSVSAFYHSTDKEISNVLEIIIRVGRVRII